MKITSPANPEFDAKHPRGFGGKFGHGTGTAQADEPALHPQTGENQDEHHRRIYREAKKLGANDQQAKNIADAKTKSEFAKTPSKPSEKPRETTPHVKARSPGEMSDDELKSAAKDHAKGASDALSKGDAAGHAAHSDRLAAVKKEQDGRAANDFRTADLPDDSPDDKPAAKPTATPSAVQKATAGTVPPELQDDYDFAKSLDPKASHEDLLAQAKEIASFTDKHGGGGPAKDADYTHLLPKSASKESKTLPASEGHHDAAEKTVATAEKSGGLPTGTKLERNGESLSLSLSDGQKLPVKIVDQMPNYANAKDIMAKVRSSTAHNPTGGYVKHRGEDGTISNVYIPANEQEFHDLPEDAKRDYLGVLYSGGGGNAGLVTHRDGSKELLVTEKAVNNPSAWREEVGHALLGGLQKKNPTAYQKVTAKYGTDEERILSSKAWEDPSHQPATPADQVLSDLRRGKR